MIDELIKEIQELKEYKEKYSKLVGEKQRLSDELYKYMMKEYEKHAVKAAIYGSKEEALRALVMNPLVGDLATAEKCFDEMLEAHKAYLPQFNKEN